MPTEVFDEIGVDDFGALCAFGTALDRRPLLGRLIDQRDVGGSGG